MPIVQLFPGRLLAAVLLSWHLVAGWVYFLNLEQPFRAGNEKQHLPQEKDSAIARSLSTPGDTLRERTADQKIADPSVDARPNTTNCAPRKGFVVLNLLGRLGNNVFELGFAHGIARELCWPVWYRMEWQSQFLNEKERQCFPDALLPPPDLTPEVQLVHGANESVLSLPSEKYEAWAKDREEDGTMLSCRHMECDISAKGIEKMLEKIRSSESKTHVVNLKAFYIHDSWINAQTLDHLKRDLAPHESCCKHQPPEDAVIIQIREFELEEDQPYVSLKAGFYIRLLQEYGLMDRPVWVVCQPASLNSGLVRELKERIPNVFVRPGEDVYDAFCIQTRAKTLILSHKSSFSQASALVASPDTVVHYPIFNMNPFLTIAMPNWKYHLANQAHDGIDSFDVPIGNMTMQYETDTNKEIDQVGRGSNRTHRIKYSCSKFSDPDCTMTRDE